MKHSNFRSHDVLCQIFRIAFLDIDIYTEIHILADSFSQIGIALVVDERYFYEEKLNYCCSHNIRLNLVNNEYVFNVN